MYIIYKKPCINYLLANVPLWGIPTIVGILHSMLNRFLLKPEIYAWFTIHRLYIYHIHLSLDSFPSNFWIGRYFNLLPNFTLVSSSIYWICFPIKFTLEYSILLDSSKSVALYSYFGRLFQVFIGLVCFQLLYINNPIYLCLAHQIQWLLKNWWWIQSMKDNFL